MYYYSFVGSFESRMELHKCYILKGVTIFIDFGPTYDGNYENILKNCLKLFDPIRFFHISSHTLCHKQRNFSHPSECSIDVYIFYGRFAVEFGLQAYHQSHHYHIYHSG